MGDDREAKIDSLCEAAVMRLRESLQHIQCDRLLVICDPSASGDVPQLLTSHHLPASKLRLASADFTDETLPYLLDVRSELAQERFVNASIRASVSEAVAEPRSGRRARFFCAWIATTVELSQAARAMTQLAQVQVEGRRRIWRYWDPRLLSHQQEVMQVHVAPSAPASATWHFIDWVGRLQVLPAADAQHKAATAQPDKLAALSMRNQVMQRVLHLQRVDDKAPVLAVDQALAQATAVGLIDDDDRVRCATHLVLHGASLLEAPAMHEIIQSVKRGEGRYAQLTMDFEAADWQQLAATAKSNTPGSTTP